MRKTSMLLLVVLAALVGASGESVAEETAACRFTGTLTLNGNNMPDGTIVKATIEGDEYTAVTPTGYGPSTYSVEILPPDGTAYADGTQVLFTVDGHPADPAGVFRSGENIRWNLNVVASLISGSPLATESSASALWIILLAIACIAQASVVGGVAYIAVTDWNT